MSDILTILKAGTGTAGRKTLPGQGEFNRMVGKRRAELRSLIKQLVTDEIDLDKFGDLFDAVLLEGHTAAWILGRQRAGDLSAETIDDILQGVAHKDPEAQWLQDFMRAIRDGDPRYVTDEGEYREAGIFNRGNLYIKKMRGTANEAFVEESPVKIKDTETLFEWFLGANEHHCEDCPRIAALSPYTASTLFAYPGSGDTECLGNCKCYLKRSDGRAGFYVA